MKQDYKQKKKRIQAKQTPLQTLQKPRKANTDVVFYVYHSTNDLLSS